MGCHYYLYYSFLNGNGKPNHKRCPDLKPFKIEILGCKIEKKNPIFSSANASFSSALKIPCEGYLNINKPRDCVCVYVIKKEKKILPSQKFAGERG